MALIEKESIAPRNDQLTVRLDPELLRVLNGYCRFVEQSLQYMFRKDRDFQQWLLRNGNTVDKKEHARKNDRETGE